MSLQPRPQLLKARNAYSKHYFRVFSPPLIFAARRLATTMSSPAQAQGIKVVLHIHESVTSTNAAVETFIERTTKDFREIGRQDLPLVFEQQMH